MPNVTNKFPARPSRPLVSKSEAKLRMKAKILASEACSCWFVWFLSHCRYMWRGDSELLLSC